MYRETVRIALITCCLALSLAVQREVQGLESAGDSDQRRFPGGVTPSDVFGRLDLLDRCLDKVLAATNKTQPQPLRFNEVQLGPPHVYQIMLACAERSQLLCDSVDVLALPTLSAKPRVYHPRDVRFVVDLMLDSLRRVATKQGIADLPTEGSTFTGKTPTDVFGRAVTVYLKFNLLCGRDEIAPTDVFAEMVRATADVRSILRQDDSETRYRIDAPKSDSGLRPADVYKKCMKIRRVINRHRLAYGVAATHMPELPANTTIQPRAVFFQVQILLAELNTLKRLSNTTSSTPLAVPVDRTKLPSDVHQQASLLEHLLRQVNSGAQIKLFEKPRE